VPVALAAALPSVREDGAGAAFRVGPGRAAVACGLAAGLALAAGLREGAILVGVAVALALALGAFFRRRFGGRTGDVLGAAAELTETAVLLAAAALA
jgi:adenosylcobinamide-GDP ribazoletransferase